jgi:hypothetical protein
MKTAFLLLLGLGFAAASADVPDCPSICGNCANNEYMICGNCDCENKGMEKIERTQTVAPFLKEYCCQYPRRPKICPSCLSNTKPSSSASCSCIRPSIRIFKNYSCGRRCTAGGYCCNPQRVRKGMDAMEAVEGFDMQEEIPVEEEMLF